MKIFAMFDANGRALSFWNDDLFPDTGDGIQNPAIPPEAVEIDPETHQKLVEGLDAWRWVNGELSAYVPPPLTIEEIRQGMPPLTARQFRLGLVAGGFSPSQVTATIASMPAGPDKDKAQIEWEYATTFNRMHPLIATVGAALGLNDTQIDAMWLAAVSL